MTQVSDEILEWLLQMAEDSIADYANYGDPAMDYGDEWPEIARKRAQHCRALEGITGRPQWGALARHLEESANNYEGGML